MRTLLKFWTLSIFLFGLGYNVQAQATACGVDFWFCFPENFYSNAEPRIQIVSDVATNGIITTGQGVNLPFSVSPGTGFITILSTAHVHIANQSVVSNKWVHIVASDTICVYAGSMRYGAADATPVLPLHSLGIDHRITCYHNLYPSTFLMCATENSTSLTITPTSTTQGGNAANVPFNISLNQGQTYLVKSTSDLTGSRVESDKPIILFGTTKCANVPSSATYCDALWDMEPSIDQWGTEYISLEFGGRSSPNDLFRVVAHTNGTQVSLNGALVSTLNAGQFYETTRNGRNVWSANFPISITQFARGTALHGAGDPAMARLVPTQWMGKYYRWPTFDVAGYITSHKINVVTKTANTGLARINGALIGGWQTVVGTPWSAAYVTGLGSGDHVLSSDSAIHGIAYGFGSVTSYAFPLGGDSPPSTVLSPGLNLNLQGSSLPQGENLLEWSISELYEQGTFHISRSADGKEWTNIHSLPAKGNVFNYSWIDKSIPQIGPNFYRISHQNLNHEMAFSNVLVMQVNGAGPGFNVFPNPFNEDLNLEFTLLESGKVYFEIYDLLGKILVKWEIEKERGIHFQEISSLCSGLVPGRYFLRMQTGGRSELQPLVKQ